MFSRAVDAIAHPQLQTHPLHAKFADPCIHTEQLCTVHPSPSLTHSTLLNTLYFRIPILSNSSVFIGFVLTDVAGFWNRVFNPSTTIPCFSEKTPLPKNTWHNCLSSKCFLCYKF